MAGEEEDVISMEEAARLLGISIGTLYRWVRSGRLPAVRANPALLRQKEPLRFRRADIEALLQGQ